METYKEPPISGKIHSNDPGKAPLRYFLLVDDNFADRLLLKRALEDSDIRMESLFMESGQELLDFLGQNAGSPELHKPSLPCLILLDLYMPRMNGQEALKVIKGDSRFKKIPVVVLTSSNAYGDILDSYNNGANSFLTKPLNYRDLVRLMGLVDDYWLQEVRLPH